MPAKKNVANHRMQPRPKMPFIIFITWNVICLGCQSWRVVFFCLCICCQQCRFSSLVYVCSICSICIASCNGSFLCTQWVAHKKAPWILNMGFNNEVFEPHNFLLATSKCKTTTSIVNFPQTQRLMKIFIEFENKSFLSLSMIGLLRSAVETYQFQWCSIWSSVIPIFAYIVQFCLWMERKTFKLSPKEKTTSIEMKKMR